jgi:hypothetical protein
MTKLTQLPNIGKVTAKMLEQIDIHTAEEFLSRDPYEIYAQLLMSVDPTLCRCALAGLVGAKLGKKWSIVTRQAAREFQTRYPKHRWKDKC